MPDISSIFLLVFLVSLGLTFVTFAAGVANLSIPGLHHADLHGHGADIAHAGAHAPDVGHGDAGHGAAQGHGAAEGVSPFNMTTILAFFTWFGGAGFVLTAYFSVLTAVAVALAALIGLGGGALVFTFLVRVLLPGQTPYLAPEDYEMAGTIGHLSVGIREGGTGEFVYSKGGTRRVASARSENGKPMEQGAEAVVVRQERGIAYVQRFDEFMSPRPQEGQ